MRVLGRASLVVFLLALAACGGGSSSSSSTTSNPLSGNWQLNLLQEFPRPQTPLSVSGFLQESNGSLAGSVEVPEVSAGLNCAGASTLTGIVSGQNVTFSINEGGTTLNFTGNIASDNKSMSGDYQGPAGGCFPAPTIGTWNAVLIPPLNGNFIGKLSNSTYMGLVTGIVPPAPISVTGTFSQSPNVGLSKAALTGTITASGYPCFTTAALTGTVSGANVVLLVFAYDGQQIGTVGLTNAPANISIQPGGLMITGSAGTSGLSLGGTSSTGAFGPCPPLFNNGASQPYDKADVAITLQ